MKKFIPIIFLALLFAGCNNETKKENSALKAELEELAAENVILAAGDLDMEVEIATYKEMLVEIDENLSSIDDKHTTVKELAEGEDATVEGDIKMHMEHIHGTMTNTKHKVAQMQENIDVLYQQEDMDAEVVLALEMELDEAAEEIMERDDVIGELHEAVVEEDFEIDALTEAYEEQASLSAVLYDALNTGYVIVGTKKELKEYGVIDSHGNFSGLGKVKSAVADAEGDWFFEVSIDETDGLDVLCKKVKLLTSHPEFSYQLVGDKVIESIAIVDKGAFWDASDFLVLEIVKK